MRYAQFCATAGVEPVRIAACTSTVQSTNAGSLTLGAFYTAPNIAYFNLQSIAALYVLIIKRFVVCVNNYFDLIILNEHTIFPSTRFLCTLAFLGSVFI
jgi:hypothetical protein